MIHHHLLRDRVQTKKLYRLVAVDYLGEIVSAACISDHPENRMQSDEACSGIKRVVF